MWIGVTPRFSKFHSNLAFTQNQIEDGLSKQLAVRQKLQSKYYETVNDTPPGMIVGSWGKRTQTRLSSDIDVFFVLPAENFQRFNNYAGNGQSALLQEVKRHLEDRYPSTYIRGDGQVVSINFNSIAVEVVPVFRDEQNDSFIIPDTNEGGTWKHVYPKYEIAVIYVSDLESNGNTRKLARMAKCWRRNCSVPLKSYQIELLCVEFMEKYKHKLESFFYFDWFFRDFFEFLCQKRNYTIWCPGICKYVPLGDAWLSRAESAHARALKACQYEYEDLTRLAGEEWQKIFGTMIPSEV